MAAPEAPVQVKADDTAATPTPDTASVDSNDSDDDDNDDDETEENVSIMRREKTISKYRSYL